MVEATSSSQCLLVRPLKSEIEPLLLLSVIDSIDPSKVRVGGQ